MYYFYIRTNIDGNVDEKIEYFRNNYTYNVQGTQRQKIKVNRYTQDFLMRNESYRLGNTPKHFAVEDSSKYVYIPAALMDANKATSSKNPKDYTTEKPVVNYNIGNMNLIYMFNNDLCNLTVSGTMGNPANPSFQLYAEQTCKGDKIPINFDEDIDSYEKENSTTMSKKNLYETIDQLREIENTLKNRFNVKNTKNLSTNFIKFSNGSDGISRGDVLSLILTFSDNLTKNKMNIQIVDRLLSLKRLGDFGQIENCKKLDIPLFTQDSMENLLAIVNCTQTIFGNNPSYIYYNGSGINSNPNLTNSLLDRNSKCNIITTNVQLQTTNYEPEYEEDNLDDFREYKTLFNKVKNSTFNTNLAKWLKERFSQIFINNKYPTKICLSGINDPNINLKYCSELDKEIITKVLNNYLKFLIKVDTLAQDNNIDIFGLYLFIKYDLYDLINTYTSGYRKSNNTKYATAKILEIVLKQILYDLDNMCNNIQMNDNENCKNIEDYLNDFKKEFEQDIKKELQYYYDEDELNEQVNRYYNNEYKYYKKIYDKQFSKSILRDKRKDDITDTNIVNIKRSRKQKINIRRKSSRDNLRKHHR